LKREGENIYFKKSINQKNQKNQKNPKKKRMKIKLITVRVGGKYDWKWSD